MKFSEYLGAYHFLTPAIGGVCHGVRGGCHNLRGFSNLFHAIGTVSAIVEVNPLVQKWWFNHRHVNTMLHWRRLVKHIGGIKILGRRKGKQRRFSIIGARARGAPKVYSYGLSMLVLCCIVLGPTARWCPMSPHFLTRWVPGYWDWLTYPDILEPLKISMQRRRHSRTGWQRTWTLLEKMRAKGVLPFKHTGKVRLHT